MELVLTAEAADTEFVNWFHDATRKFVLALFESQPTLDRNYLCRFSQALIDALMRDDSFIECYEEGKNGGDPSVSLFDGCMGICTESPEALTAWAEKYLDGSFFVDVPQDEGYISNQVKADSLAQLYNVNNIS